MQNVANNDNSNLRLGLYITFAVKPLQLQVGYNQKNQQEAVTYAGQHWYTMERKTGFLSSCFLLLHLQKQPGPRYKSRCSICIHYSQDAEAAHVTSVIHQ